jgi:AcrR family transcriptional regulator
VDNSRYQQQRTEAIKAAAAVFSEKGFHGASTKEIAERMGIKQGSLYYYFRSKEEALGEVCLLGLEDYVERMEKIANSEQPFETKLMATLTSHLSSYRDKNEALKVYADERLYLPADKRTPLKELGSHYRQLLEGIFEEGIREGVIRESIDCHFAALAVIGICRHHTEVHRLIAAGFIRAAESAPNHRSTNKSRCLSGKKISCASIFLQTDYLNKRRKKNGRTKSNERDLAGWRHIARGSAANPSAERCDNLVHRLVGERQEHRCRGA